MNKTAASAAQLAKCIFFHVYYCNAVFRNLCDCTHSCEWQIWFGWELQSYNCW